MIKELFPNLFNFKIKKLKYIKNFNNKISLKLIIYSSFDKYFIKNILEYFLNKKLISINIQNQKSYKVIYITYNY
uniref:Uncharacterized protein n=1 Tax=Nephromyces sp. ex Molgula occidentalis TaxID=2544991 RepID=A0A5C1H899_9APIC|nr:hypothetical protein [Nephromyces sp. ex Molgula occidentalis]